MTDKRGRRPRGRRRVQYEEVLPLTDLPPLVQGDLRCFLVVDIGRICWSSTTTAQVPPASPAYVRLRWWGETTDGTLFKPYSAKSEKPVKCRCRFGVRSGAKQMSAYFVDMGSIVFEVLTSPKSVPLGRIQIPKVAHLTSSNPIRDFFPIYSASSRKIGELEVHIRFKSLEGAYDLTSDTGTNTSMSSRSRPPSEIGRRSRSRGSSTGSRSNRGSARSRSSSTGSKKSGRKKKRSTTRSKGRRRSRSTESNGSSASKRSQSIKNASTMEPSAPRGIDDLLQQNGHDLYGLGSKPPRKSSVKSVEQENMGRKKHEPPVSSQQDAISVLLHRGNQLREDILKSQFETNMPKSSAQDVEAREIANPLFEAAVTRQPSQNDFLPPDHAPTAPPLLRQPTLATPIKERRQDLDMRMVDLVFGSQEFKGQPAFLHGTDASQSVSPLSSMISEFEDNPLYDESLLQQMFYNNGATTSFLGAQRDHAPQRDEKPEARDTKEPPVNVSAPSPQKLDRDHLLQRLADRVPGLSVRRLLELQKVHSVAVTVETLALNQSEESLPKTNLQKGRRKGGKPPVPSPKGKQKSGTYFVEFRFPEASTFHRKHPSNMTTSHEVTRVASRKSNATGVVAFDERCEFQFRFNEANLRKWTDGTMEFIIYHRKPSDQKANQVGSAAIQLRELLISNNFEFDLDVNVKENRVFCGNMRVFIELIATPQAGDRPTPPSPDNLAREIETVPKEIEEIEQEKAAEEEMDDAQRQGSTIALSPSTSVLYMMLMVKEGFNIPGTTVIMPRQGMVTHPPNVFLVCRTLTSGESQKTSIVWGKSNPKFDFVQISPLKVDDALIARMQNNFVIVEVWTRIMTNNDPNSDKLLGLAKLPTHHFYQSLKDEEISSVVLGSLHPMVSVDESVPIVDLFTGQERGQLHVTLALGTQVQISTLRQVKSDIQGKRAQQHHLEQKKSTESDHKMAGPVEHVFELNVIKLNGFKPQNNQVWGETDCFVQYHFPTQINVREADESTEKSDSAENLKLASMKKSRTDVTLCIPDPVFNDARRHTFSPPPSVPVQRILLSCCYSDGMADGIPFELWSRYYHPNVRDQVLAKGILPIAKLGALVSMTNSKVSEQTFHIPMEFVDAEQSHDHSAGKLEIHVKYKASGTTLESTQPPMKFSKPVILRVGLLRACGLKAAAVFTCRHSNSDLKYCADVGVNTYVEMKPSFLPDEETRTSRVVAQNFAPEYQHHTEIACPLVSYHRDVTPVSLSELLLSGEMEITVWHRPEDGDMKRSGDILLASLVIPMRSLLHKTTGVNTWYPLKAPERKCSSSDDASMVGGMEISMTFASSNDLDLILKAAKATGWSLPPFETRLLNDNVNNSDITGINRVTFSVTVTNAWLPKHEVLLHGRTTIDKSASVYLRYKFFDHDSVTSSLCALVSKQPHSIDARFENLTSARLAHKKSFISKKSRPLNWYLREEKLELQLWLTHSIGSKKSRPLDSDKLLGSCYLDLSTISDLEKEQHISGSFNIFKAGAEDLGGGHVRVYVSMKPGDIVDPVPDPLPEKAPSEENTVDSDEMEKISPKSSQQKQSDSVFLAVVTVERAMHLPLVGDLETDKSTEPNSFVSYEIVDDTTNTTGTDDLKMVTTATRISVATPNPAWNDVKDVALPRHLLTGMHGALLLKVWHRDCLYLSTESDATGQAKPYGSGTELMATDRMLGFATMDLSVLRAGFRDVNGWYNILDIHGQCQGQLKVAVTPTHPLDPFQPNTARSCDSSQKTQVLPQTEPPPGPKVPNFLHQAPLKVPVRTPSGSMYFPGLPNSAQTVGTTCKMTEAEESDFLHKARHTTENYAKKFSDDFSQKLHVANASSTSMFRYVNSDRQQACLVNTLEKQMQELESIKKKFEERRADGFTPQDNNALRPQKIQSDSFEMHLDPSKSDHYPTQNGTNQHLETPLPNSPRQSPSFDAGKHRTNETILHIRPTTDPNYTALPNLEIYSGTPQGTTLGPVQYDQSSQAHKVINRDQSNMWDPTLPKSVHLSLYAPPKKSDFNDRAMSDNEVNSDLEFVQPRSLNESASSDFAEISSKTTKKPPRTESRNQRHPEIVVTPARSEGHSVLEDTSLWLTGSTLRVSGFSSDEEHEKVEPKAVKCPPKVLDTSGRFTPSPSAEDPRRPSVDDERIVTRSSSAVSSDEDSVSGQEDRNPDQTGRKTEDVPSESEDSDHHSLPSKQPTLVEEEETQRDMASAANSEETELSSTTTDDDERESIDPDQGHGLKVSVSKETSKQQTSGSSAEDKRPHIEERTVMKHPTLSRGPIQIQPREVLHGESTTRDPLHDENLCPNKTVQPSRTVTNQKVSFPSFFPPSHNLEASMRALQEATLRHKHDLLKKKEPSTSTEPPTGPEAPVQTRPKKLPPRPADYSDEKTRRLARIFRTKFSS